MAASKAIVRERAAASLWGIFIGDALAMPVHWYYNLATLKQHFPKGESSGRWRERERVKREGGRE
jgi:ADP-ribosylglycohydrolase